MFRTASLHEPPLFALLADEPDGLAMLEEAQRRVQGVIAEIEAGENEAGARRFTDEVALGEGAWQALPPEIRATFVRNAATFVEEERDPTAYGVDLEALSSLVFPVLLTQGDQSPPVFPPVIDRLEAALPNTERRVFAGAGHAPHQTHPGEYAAAILEFADR